MTRGSGSADPGVETVIYADAWIRVLRILASHLFLEICTLIFISGFMPDAWIQKHVVVSVKSKVPYHIVPFRSLYYILF